MLPLQQELAVFLAHDPNSAAHQLVQSALDEYLVAWGSTREPESLGDASLVADCRVLVQMLGNLRVSEEALYEDWDKQSARRFKCRVSDMRNQTINLNFS
jgi:hypothetical protein